MRSYILIVGDDGALLVPPHFKNSIFVNDKDSPHYNPIIQEIAQHSNIPVLILADVLAQEFRREILPKLGVSDRKKFIARKLKQLFPAALDSEHASFSAALPLQKHSTLFARLHGGGNVSLWLELISKLPNKSGHVALLPLESAGMVKKLLPEASKGWAVLISWQRTGGFRQIVTLDGDLIFSRLTPQLSENTDANDIAAAIGNDIRATKGYLARFGLTDTTPFHLIAVMPEYSHAAIAEFSLPVNSVFAITPHSAAKKLGLAFAPVTDDFAGDIVHAAWLAKKKRPCLLMASRETLHYWRNQFTRRLGIITATSFWIFATIFFIWRSGLLINYALETRKLYENTVLLQQQSSLKRQELSPITEPLGRIRLALERKRLFSAPVPSPWKLLQIINSDILQIARVTKLDWSNDKDEILQISLRLEMNAPPMQAQEIDELEVKLKQTLPDYEVRLISKSNDATTADFTIQRSRR